MPLNKSKGNMYDFVTHTHNHMGGECPHNCCYCSTKNLVKRYGMEKYAGPLRLIEVEFDVQYGIGKTIFTENCNDLFAEQVPIEFIGRIIEHCRKFPDNQYVFQTKNPARLACLYHLLPAQSLVGTTIETNRVIPGVSLAPTPEERMKAMVDMPGHKFVTIEPIMDFDPDILAEWIMKIRPDFINIGADSKGSGIPEPKMWKINAFMENILLNSGIAIRKKTNLERLMK